MSALCAHLKAEQFYQSQNYHNGCAGNVAGSHLPRMPGAR
jgi:hypothetical protein